MSNLVLLLPYLSRLRDKFVRGGRLGVEELKIFAASMTAPADVALMFDAVAAKDADLARRAMSAAFFSGGLSGFGDEALDRFIKTRDYDVAIDPVFILEQSVLDCRDSTALKALLGIAEWEIGTNYDEATESLTKIRGIIGDYEYEQLKHETHYCGRYILASFVRPVSQESSRSQFRRAWQLKQYVDNVEVRAALERTLDVPGVRWASAYVLTCFSEACVDVEALFAKCVPWEVSVNTGWIINMIASLSIRYRDARYLKMLKLIDTGDYCADDMARLLAWCKEQIATPVT